MMQNTYEILYLIASDFAQLTSVQQKNVGIRLGLVQINIIANQDEEIVAQTIFSKAYKDNKMPELLKEMRKYIYE